jgi:hypothetical protein
VSFINVHVGSPSRDVDSISGDTYYALTSSADLHTIWMMDWALIT